MGEPKTLITIKSNGNVKWQGCLNPILDFILKADKRRISLLEVIEEKGVAEGYSITDERVSSPEACCSKKPPSDLSHTSSSSSFEMLEAGLPESLISNSSSTSELSELSENTQNVLNDNHANEALNPTTFSRNSSSSSLTQLFQLMELDS